LGKFIRQFRAKFIKVPGFTLTETGLGAVRKVTDYGGGETIGNLTAQHHQSTKYLFELFNNEIIYIF
jgi:hypothetical protein